MSQPVETTASENGATTENKVTEGTGTEGQRMSYEDLEKELSKVRNESASRRVELRDYKQKADEWDKYQESQKTELQKLQEQLAEREKALASKDVDILRAKIASQYNVAEEDYDLLTGDEENMKRLAAKLGKEKGTTSSNGPSTLLAGNRGKPLGNEGNNFSMENFIRGLAKK